MTILYWLCKCDLQQSCIFVSKKKWKSIKCWEDYETWPWLCHRLWLYMLETENVSDVTYTCLKLLWGFSAYHHCLSRHPVSLHLTKEIHSTVLIHFKRMNKVLLLKPCFTLLFCLAWCSSLCVGVYLPPTVTQPLLKDRSSMAITSYGSLLLNISPLINTCTHTYH